MTPLCERLITHLKDAVDEEGNVRHEVQDLMGELQVQLLLRGPTAVIKASVDWMRSIPANLEDLPPGDPTVLLGWERVLRAIRHDLGHNNADLKPGDLLRVYVTDIDDFLPAT